MKTAMLQKLILFLLFVILGFGCTGVMFQYFSSYQQQEELLAIQQQLSQVKIPFRRLSQNERQRFQALEEAFLTKFPPAEPWPKQLHYHPVHSSFQFDGVEIPVMSPRLRALYDQFFQIVEDQQLESISIRVPPVLPFEEPFLSHFLEGQEVILEFVAPDYLSTLKFVEKIHDLPLQFSIESHTILLLKEQVLRSYLKLRFFYRKQENPFGTKQSKTAKGALPSLPELNTEQLLLIHRSEWGRDPFFISPSPNETLIGETELAPNADENQSFEIVAEIFPETLHQPDTIPPPVQRFAHPITPVGPAPEMEDEILSPPSEKPSLRKVALLPPPQVSLKYILFDARHNRHVAAVLLENEGALRVLHEGDQVGEERVHAISAESLHLQSDQGIRQITFF